MTAARGAALLALLLVLAACSSTEQVTQVGAASPTATSPTAEVAPTPTTVTAEVTDDEDSGGVGIPLPPAENLVEFPEAVPETPASAAELRDHPLAAGVLTPFQLKAIFGGQWQTTWATTVDRDSILVPNGQDCDAGTIDRVVDAIGIDLNYSSLAGTSIELNLRRGAEVDVLVEGVRQLVSCELGPDVFPGRAIASTADQLRIAHTSHDGFSGIDYYTSFLLVNVGDLVVAASVDADSEADAAANEELLDIAVSTVLEQLDD